MLYFAWIPASNTPFDPVAHARQDLTVFSFELTEEEGQAPNFSLEVVNPGLTGILSQAYRYALVSEKTDTDAQPVLLARGKVSGAPSELSGPTLTLEFSCVQSDAIASLKAYANTLRTNNSAYDPLFISESEEDQPETALNGRPLAFYWDRKTLAISTTSIVQGSRTVDVGANALVGLTVRLTQPPVRHARLQLSASWTQRASGVTELQPAIGSSISSFTWEDVQQWFPKTGDSLGDGTGWTCAFADLTPSYQVEWAPFYVGDISHTGEDPSSWTLKSQVFRLQHLQGRYDYQQARQETVEILAEIGTQDVLGDDRIEVLPDEDLRDVTLDPLTDEWKPDTQYHVNDQVIYNSNTYRCLIDHISTSFFALQQVAVLPSGYVYAEKLWEKITGQSPIGDTRRPAYFSTDRGRRSVEHAVEILRCFLLNRARCIEVTFDLPWDLARDITVDDSMRVESSQIPGGEATGKVTKVTLKADDSGNRLATVTLGVLVGTGQPSPPPEYAPSDYFQADNGDTPYSDYQYDHASSETDRVTASGVVYVWPNLEPETPINAFRLGDVSYCVLQARWSNIAVDQYLRASIAGSQSIDPIETLANNPTRMSFKMRPLPQTDLKKLRYLVTCKPMSCPQGINLGAS